MADPKDFEKAVKKENKRHEKAIADLAKKLALKLKQSGR